MNNNMNVNIQGTFVSEKINRVRWVPEEYTETKSFLTGSWDNDENSIKMWTFETNFEEEDADYPQVINTYPFDGDITELKFVDKSNIVASSSNGFVKLLALSNYDKKTPFKESITWDNLHYYKNGTPSACTGLAVMDGDVVSVGEDGRMNFLTSHQSQVVRTIDNADSCSLHCVCFLKHNEVLTGNLRGQMKIWDLRSQSNSPAATFLLSGDQVAATSIVHHPTQRHLILAGSENGALAVWDLRVNTYPASLLNAHSAAVSEIQFHPDHPQRLFTCSASGEIWHWNTATMSKQITTTMNASLAINESTINPWLMSDEDRANLEVVSLMSDLHKPINSIDCNKNRVLCGCDNEAVYLIKDVYT